MDTSAAYMGGFSEKMVGAVLDRRRESGEDDGKDLTIISKFGYVSVSILFSSLDVWYCGGDPL